MKTWLITGCSSGIGKGIAKAVLESGDQAIVTARNKGKVMDIVEAYPETALAVSLKRFSYFLTTALYLHYRAVISFLCSL